MDKKEFKVGDRVRLTTNIELDDCFLQNGETAYVEEVEDDLIIIKMEARKRFCVENFEIELVADADPKTAFLNDLSELLRKYDVFLIAHDTDMPISAYFNNSKDYDQFATIGKEKNKGCGVIIEPDTIINNNLL